LNVPRLGEVTKDERFDCYYSQPVAVAMLDGVACKVVLEEYDEEPNKDAYHQTIANLLSASPVILKNAARYIYEYYEDICACYGELEPDFPRIHSAESIWAHIQLGKELYVSRRGYGDNGMYVSLECNCDWEPEHGLQIVFKNGNVVCKVGPYDGHLTNSDAYADDSLEHVVYRRIA
jgi:hypothetical protein